MLWFARIFSLYLLILGSLPCADYEHDEHSEQNKHEAVFKTADTQASEHHSCHDPCSPLCICVCCGCVTISVNTPALESLQDNRLVKDGQSGYFYQEPFSSEHLSALFRPPINKLG